MVGREDGVGERVLVEFGIFVFMCVHIYTYKISLYLSTNLYPYMVQSLKPPYHKNV